MRAQENLLTYLEPASMTRTWKRSFSDKRFASTAPAVPPIANIALSEHWILKFAIQPTSDNDKVIVGFLQIAGLVIDGTDPQGEKKR